MSTFDLSRTNENFQKAIPSMVFYNHFWAIHLFIWHSKTKYKLKEVDFYNSIKIKNPNFKVDEIRKLLWNSWSTELAFNLTSDAENKEFYRFALHWHFPQAYYSIYLAMTAFHETQGMANEQHEKSIKLFGNSVKDNHYPNAISFYCQGNYKDFTFHGIDVNERSLKGFSSLTSVITLEDSEKQIASFLKSTRDQNAKNKRRRGEKSHAKDPRFQTKKGLLTQNFKKKHWDIIYNNIPETSLLNLLYRLRIKANYHDIESFINADIDFKSFHSCLGGIINYLNFVHEAYIHKAIGDAAYQEILYSFNNGQSDLLPIKRYENLITNK